ncbi:ABC transporter ATP-binding protein [soil metagenome]
MAEGPPWGAHDSGEEYAAYLSGVTVDYPGRPRLGPLDILINTGEIIAIVGASGAGKSTVLRLLAGLERGHGAVARTPGATTGFVFQSPTLMPWADALTNVALPLELTGVSHTQARARAAAALAAVGLDDRTTALPRQLSGGMTMRVSLARALVTEPDLLLLDEPFAALDSITRRGLIEDLHQIWNARRPAIVFVTHDVEEAVYFADRVVVLGPHDGNMTEAISTPGPIPRKPQWRLDPDYRKTVERVAEALAASMALPA